MKNQRSRITRIWRTRSKIWRTRSNRAAPASGTRTRDAIPLVIHLLREHGYAVRHKKTFNAGLRCARIVTGYTVDKPRMPSVARAEQRRIRSATHELVQERRARKPMSGLTERLRGRVAHYIGNRRFKKVEDRRELGRVLRRAAPLSLKAAAIQWDDGSNAGVDSTGIIRQLEEASSRPGVVARNEGNAERALAVAAQRLEATYQLPFLAHAAMEPMNCTVRCDKDACEIWVGTQAPTLTQALVAEMTGLPKDAIKIHNHLLGGGFGRRLEADGTLLAVKIARQVSGPVKVVWSREER